MFLEEQEQVEGVLFRTEKNTDVLFIVSQRTTFLSYRKRHPVEHSATRVVLRDVVDLFSVYYTAPVQTSPCLVRILEDSLT